MYTQVLINVYIITHRFDASEFPFIFLDSPLLLICYGFAVNVQLRQFSRGEATVLHATI